MTERGKWVAFEGPDGAGKTLLSKKLHELYPEALLLPSPSCSITGEFARSALSVKSDGLAPEARQLLFLADIIDTYMRVVMPTLAKGQMVISDRWVVSTVVYQLAMFEMMGDIKMGSQVTAAMSSYYGEVTHGMGPDLTFYVDSPPRVRVKRLKDREGFDWNEHSANFQEIVAETYKAAKQSRWYFAGAGISMTIPGSNEPDHIVKMCKADIDRIEAPLLPVGPTGMQHLKGEGLL